MGKAFTTAVRWLAPLGAILAPRRTHNAGLNDANLGAQASKRMTSGCEAPPPIPQASQDLVGIALEQAVATVVRSGTAATARTRGATGKPIS